MPETTTSQAPQGGSTSPAKSPQEEDPRENFEIEQAKLEKLTKANAALKEELTASEGAEKESEQALAGYEKAQPALQSKVDDAKEYLRVKMPMVEAAVGEENKEAIDAAIDDYDTDLEKRDADVKKLENEKGTAKRDYETAADKVKKDQAKFDEAKNYLVAVTAGVSTFQSLVPKIEGADPARPATMYFLTREAKDAVPKKLDSIDDLRKKLSGSLQALRDSRRVAREAKDAWEGKTIDLEQARKALLARHATRQERLLKTVANYDSEAKTT